MGKNWFTTYELNRGRFAPRTVAVGAKPLLMHAIFATFGSCFTPRSATLPVMCLCKCPDCPLQAHVPRQRQGQDSCGLIQHD